LIISLLLQILSAMKVELEEEVVEETEATFEMSVEVTTTEEEVPQEPETIAPEFVNVYEDQVCVFTIAFYRS